MIDVRRGPPIIGYHPWRQLQVVSFGGWGIVTLPPDISRIVFGYSLNEHDIPDVHICPLIQQIPVDPVHWDIPNLLPHFLLQVFERSMLVRHISTLGSLASYRNVSHPLTRQSVPRSDAMVLKQPETLGTNRSACSIRAIIRSKSWMVIS